MPKPIKKSPVRNTSVRTVKTSIQGKVSGVYSGLLGKKQPRGTFTLADLVEYQKLSEEEWARIALLDSRIRVDALFSHYGIDPASEDRFEKGFFALARAHVPAFQVQGKRGRPRKATARDKKSARGRPQRIDPSRLQNWIKLVDRAKTELERGQSRRVTDKAAVTHLLKKEGTTVLGLGSQRELRRRVREFCSRTAYGRAQQKIQEK
jgi:hypothetical protein